MDGIDGEDCIRQTSPMGKTKTAGKFGMDFPTVFIYRFNGIPTSLYPRWSIRRSSEIVFIREVYNAPMPEVWTQDSTSRHFIP